MGQSISCPVSNDYSAENISKLVGTRARLQPDTAQVEAKVCSSLAYEDKRASREELNQLGVNFKSA